MLRRFFKDSVLYGFAGLLSRGISVILVPVYTRILAPGDFGVVDLVAVFASLVNVLVPLGISSGIARYYPEARSGADKSAYASSALWFTVAAYTVFSLAALSISGPLARLLLGDPAWQPVFRLGIASICATGLFYFFQNLLRWQLKPRLYILSSLASTVVTAVVAVFCVVVLRNGVAGIITGQIAGGVAGSVIAWHANREVYAFTFKRSSLTMMLVFSLPIVPALASEFVTNYVDRIAVRTLLGVSELGIYGIGFRFASVVSLLMIGFNSSLTPLIYNSYREEGTPGDIARIFRVFLALALPFQLCIALFSKEIVLVFTTPKFYGAWRIIPILSLALMMLTLYNFAPGMDIAKRTRMISLIHLATALINTALNFTLIPLLGIAGSALATMVSAAFSFAVYMAMSQRLYYVPHNWGRILAAVAMAALFALCGTLLFPEFRLSAGTVIAKLGLACLFWVGSLPVIFGVAETKALWNRVGRRLPLRLGQAS
ncbi:lipopolysaccharide biosynthesis protein [Geomonas azotofigens]|uniref:lipopolysaccharide biosynthesis protein n=1 Tax=Geomonas azotofigens TaxID=2843196 RepID=UPI001C120D4D|nr:oligosaccharide flippase family protein [Geomonas azotofigens]MBU5613379.1 oligosaccharide flippase family protein [Geomonas azotofigens]